jgi:hypothetical protein
MRAIYCLRTSVQDYIHTLDELFLKDKYEDATTTTTSQEEDKDPAAALQSVVHD